jgi:hypothetical protein
MELHSCRQRIKECVLIILASLVLVAGSPTLANGLVPKINLSEPGKHLSAPIELSVRGASAGITTDNYEQAVVDALGASDLFPSGDNRHYALDIRIVSVATPSFSKNMTVSMKAVWKLVCRKRNVTLLEENIVSTYTGGLFEGGFIGANRVRVAMEGATRESIRAGMELLATLDLDT